MAMVERPSVVHNLKVVLVVWLSTMFQLHVFSSETAEPITAKLHVEHPLKGKGN